jgi:FixJ family two-component response regulator
MNSSAIAAQLQVSVEAIQPYRSNIEAKLNVESAADLIRLAACWAERL